MPNLRITIDGEVQMDGDLGTWSTEPPFITAQKLAIAAKRDQPSAIPIMGLVAKAATGEHISAIEVRTLGDGWEMKVTG